MVFLWGQLFLGDSLLSQKELILPDDYYGHLYPDITQAVQPYWILHRVERRAILIAMQYDPSCRQRFHRQYQRVYFMRGKTLLVILLMLAAGLTVPNAGAEAQDDGSSQAIKQSQKPGRVTLTLNGDVTVTDGGVLTIDSTISVETGSSITVRRRW